jgi:hypothetical protein
LDNSYIVAADEDFEPYGVQALNITDEEDFPAPPALGSSILNPGTVIQGDTVFVGRACPGGPAVPAGNGTQIAVMERGSCRLVDKLATLEQAGGYKANVIFNVNNGALPGATSCNRVLSLSAQLIQQTGSIPSFGISPREVGYDLFGLDGTYDDAACLAATADELAPIEIGTVGEVVRLKYAFNGWGYVHLFSNGEGKLQELDTFAIPEGHDQSLAAGHGDLTVHEVAMSQRSEALAYFSYYSGGLRVARIVNGRLEETGRFIDQGGNNFWGVQVWEKDGKEYVLASDRDYGLYIFEYTGPGKVNP